MSDPGASSLDLVVVGAGPVGLLAGILAADAGLRVQVLEADPTPRRHSRAIGIHPPILRMLQALPGGPGSAPSLAGQLVAAGIRVRRGQAFQGPLGARGSHVGTLPFDHLEPPFDFVLTVPQWQTEAILEEALRGRGGGRILRRGVRVLGAEEMTGTGDPGLGLRAIEAGKGPMRLSAAFVLACDGRGSTLRREAGIAFEGAPYRHRYLMGDFATGGAEARVSTGASLGPDEAGIFVTPTGLVESFPLEPGVRRWVVERAPGTGVEVKVEELVEAVRERTGVALDPAGPAMVSAFGVERYLAAEPWKGRLLLAGDAAHVVSPIGGQGMNLGWWHAARAVQEVTAVIRGERSREEAARRYAGEVRRRARTVAARAEGNMRLGQRLPGGSAVLHALRVAALRILLHSPLRRPVARRFTMHGLGQPPGS